MAFSLNQSPPCVNLPVDPMMFCMSTVFCSTRYSANAAGWCAGQYALNYLEIHQETLMENHFGKLVYIAVPI